MIHDNSHPAVPRRGYLAGLGVMFFLSGIAGLVYQVLWLRLLSLTFGVTVYAATTVLAAFMAGLGTGSFLGGRLAARTSNPLRWFGVAELLIGVSALATPAALAAATGLYASLHSTIGASPVLLTTVRFACSLLVLLVPTTLMGASLPLLVRASLDGDSHTGRHVGVLYACNTAGAIVGAVATGFYLIGAVGIHASFVLAAGLNVGVGAVAVVAAWRWYRQSPPGQALSAAGGPAAGTAAHDERVRRAVLGVFAVSGLAALALEVIWFRILVLLLPATAYAFTTMLAAVLGGIAAGSAAAVPLMRRNRDWPYVLAGLEIGIGVAAVASMYALAVTYQAGWRTSGMIQASVLAIVPAAFLMGMAFPIGARIWAREPAGQVGTASARVGSLYAVNVAGAILGSVIAGFVLLPWLGSRASLLAVAGAQVATGCVLMVLSAGAARAALPVAAGVALWLVPAAALPDPFATALTYRHPTGERVLWSEEGLQTTVSINSDPAGRRVMYLDGLHQANDTPEMLAVHRMIGHLPMLLHPDPARALVVGLGGGATAGAVARHGTSVDVVELSASVVRGAEWFRHVNWDVLRQPNVRLRLDDGRNHLLLSGRRYDVITADIIQPIHAGAGNLYSVEYFRLARSALNRDGLMLQWIGHRDETQYTLIVRTFLRVFPHATAWVDGSLLVGSLVPLEIRPEVIERKLAVPRVQDAVSSVGVADVESLLRLYTAGPDEIRRFVGEGLVLADDRPLVEYHRSLPAADQPLDLSSLRGDVSEVLRTR
jgi:spermidine synthase